MIRVTGLNEAIRTIKRFKRSVKDKTETLVETLMNEGYDIAAYGFATADYAGPKNLTLNTPTWADNTLWLVAEGETVAFIEFGSGVTFEDYPDPSIYAKGVSPHGTYGSGKGANPPWVYAGDPGNTGYVLATRKGISIVRTTGNPPARAMYDASRVFDQDHVIAVAREVFHD